MLWVDKNNKKRIKSKMGIMTEKKETYVDKTVVEVETKQRSPHTSFARYSRVHGCFYN